MFTHYIAGLLGLAPNDLTAEKIAEMASNLESWAKRIEDIGKN